MNRKNLIQSDNPLDSLLADIRACQQCSEELPFAPRPVVVAKASARLLIIGQAPGTRVQASGIPWDDPSGKRLRQWMGVDDSTFYDAGKIAIMPMGFCYPGKGKSGDLPPKAICSELWHQRLLDQLPNIELTLLIGQYAQRAYLDKRAATLTETVRQWRDYPCTLMPLPHPSPRNQIWLKKNPWFERECVPELRNRVSNLLSYAGK